MPDGNGNANGRGAGGGRSFFVQRNLETGRHEAYEQAIDGGMCFAWTGAARRRSKPITMTPGIARHHSGLRP